MNYSVRDSFRLSLKTFPNWSQNIPVRDNFYYSGIEDKCQCTYCVGVSEAPPSSRNAWMETSQPQTPADKPGVTRPKYREYSLEPTRLASFIGWPSQMKQKPEVLAQAGFFYLGDKVKCFCCGGILWDCDPENEPFTEHAKWFPKCPWLSFSKGDPFIERVQRKLKIDFNGTKHRYTVNDLGASCTAKLSMFGNLHRIFRRSLLLQKTTESAQHSMNETIIATNRSFLIEELSTLALVRAYTDKGITCFDGLDGTLGRQQRAEGFLTILKKNNLVDSLFDILLEQDMICVLDRLNNCRNAYSADPQILRRNILNNLANILANVDIDDVREIFIEREVLSSSIFDEIGEKYSKSEDQMIPIMIAIIKLGPCAMRTLVDVLYIKQLDSLADSLLRRTPNEMQEMEDNTQTDEEFILDWDDKEG